MSIRNLLATMFAATALVAGLSSCSSPSPSETACTPEEPQKWTSVPSNFDANRIAEALDVPVGDIATGSTGWASCSNPVSVDRIGTTDPPIVEVIGIGDSCLVIGIREQPKAGMKTNNVWAVCPSS